jgi:hypothetical protein
LLPNGNVEFPMEIGAHEQRDMTDKLRLSLIGKGDDHIWLISEVDYADRFGGIHKGGFCRCWNAQGRLFQIVAETNLLNFDRPMTEQERRNYPHKQKPQQCDS